MDTDEKWAESKAKERVGQNFIKSILELSGYKVMNFGIENHNTQIIRIIKGNYDTDTNQRLMCMPDYVIVDPDTKKAALVEVKYRHIPEYFDWRKTNLMFRYRTIHDYLEYWKDLTLIFALNVKPFCICVKLNDVDWNVHFKEKRETSEGRMDEIWNFSGLYRLINEVFPKVTDEAFTKARKINNFGD